MTVPGGNRSRPAGRTIAGPDPSLVRVTPSRSDIGADYGIDAPIPGPKYAPRRSRSSAGRHAARVRYNAPRSSPVRGSRGNRRAVSSRIRPLPHPSRVGSGGMATVHLAEDLEHHRRVAIKVMKPATVAAFGHDRVPRAATQRMSGVQRHVGDVTIACPAWRPSVPRTTPERPSNGAQLIAVPVLQEDHVRPGDVGANDTATASSPSVRGSTSACGTSSPPAATDRTKSRSRAASRCASVTVTDVTDVLSPVVCSRHGGPQWQEGRAGSQNLRATMR
ncbi:hypothetical protein BH24ACI5_BH24ACI5_13420 [soil metagenome]